jgi:hypothetical protein
MLSPGLKADRYRILTDENDHPFQFEQSANREKNSVQGVNVKIRAPGDMTRPLVAFDDRENLRY